MAPFFPCHIAPHSECHRSPTWDRVWGHRKQRRKYPLLSCSFMWPHFCSSVPGSALSMKATMTFLLVSFLPPSLLWAPLPHRPLQARIAAAAAWLGSWESALTGSADCGGPGVLIAGIITNHHTAWLLLFPSTPAHFPWGLRFREATEGKQTLCAFCIPIGRWDGCSPRQQGYG